MRTVFLTLPSCHYLKDTNGTLSVGLWEYAVKEGGQHTYTSIFRNVTLRSVQVESKANFCFRLFWLTDCIRFLYNTIQECKFSSKKELLECMLAMCLFHKRSWDDWWLYCFSECFTVMRAIILLASLHHRTSIMQWYLQSKVQAQACLSAQNAFILEGIWRCSVHIALMFLIINVREIKNFIYIWSYT